MQAGLYWDSRCSRSRSKSQAHVPTPLGSALSGVQAQCLPLLPTPQKGRLGLWSFCVLLFIICLNCTNSYQLETIRNYLSPRVCLYFVAEGDICWDSSIAAKCPRLQPVSNVYKKCKTVYIYTYVCVCIMLYVYMLYIYICNMLCIYNRFIY